jgi:hypothetical protein
MSRRCLSSRRPGRFSGLLWSCVLIACLTATATADDLRAERDATRAAAGPTEPPVAVLDGAPQPPRPSASAALPAGPAVAGRTEQTGRFPGDDRQVVPAAGARSLSTITDEAGMAVPRGGDDVVIARSPDLDGPAELEIASDGTYFVGVAAAGAIQIYRSEDSGESWSLWSTLSDPDAFLFFLPDLLIAEGLQDRLFIAYATLPSGDGQVRVAYADIHAASPTWTVVTALAAPGIDIGHSQRISLATDADDYDDYFLYLVALADDGNGDDIWFARSIDQGNSFQAGYQLASSGVGGITDCYDPAVAYSDGHVHAVFSTERGTSGFDVLYRRAPAFANGGPAGWELPQDLVPGFDNVTALAMSTGPAGAVYVKMLTFSPGEPALRWSTDLGATWPAGNVVPSGQLLEGSAVAPVTLPGGQLTIVGLEGGGVGAPMEVIESRASVADPASWSAPVSYSRHLWSGASTYNRIEAVHPDPAFDGRIAFAWLQTSEPDMILRFDAEWRRDPGYPNTDVGFPIDVLGGGFTPPAIAEVDGDPQREIVFGTRSGDIHVLNHDGTPLPGWPVNVGELPYDAPVAVGNLGHGTVSIVTGNTAGEVFAFAPNGTLRPGWPVTMDVPGNVYVSIGHLGSPPLRHVVALCENEMRAIRFDGQDMSPGWGTFTETLTRPAAIGDVDGDGENEIVTAKGGFLHVHSLSVNGNENFRFVAGQVFSDAPTLADIDGDGTLEIAAPTSTGNLFLMNHDLTDWSAAWPVAVAPGQALSGVAFANILGTSEPELMFAERFTGLVHVYYATGTPQATFPKTSGSTALWLPPMVSPVNVFVANVNVGTTSGTAQSWRNLGGVPLGWPKNLPGGTEMTMAGGDLDGDGRNELVVLGLDYLTVLDVGIEPEVNDRWHWPMYGYDAQRTGCLDCEQVVTGVDDELPAATITAAAVSAHPNPFNPATVVAYEVDRAGPVTVSVFDAAGRRVATLVEREHREPGRYTVGFAADRLASGVYFVRLQTTGGAATGKAVLLK